MWVFIFQMKNTYIFIKLVKQDEVIEDKNKLKMQFNTKEKWSNNDWRSILANNIIFEIHIWRFVVS
jgi:hypothetical protein